MLTSETIDSTSWCSSKEVIDFVIFAPEGGGGTGHCSKGGPSKCSGYSGLRVTSKCGNIPLSLAEHQDIYSWCHQSWKKKLSLERNTSVPSQHVSFPTGMKTGSKWPQLKHVKKCQELTMQIWVKKNDPVNESISVYISKVISWLNVSHPI